MKKTVITLASVISALSLLLLPLRDPAPKRQKKKRKVRVRLMYPYPPLCRLKAPLNLLRSCPEA